MKKFILIIVMAFSALTVLLPEVALAKTTTPEPVDLSFSITTHNYNFVYTTTTSGTLTFDIDATGIMKNFKNGSGTFSVVPIDAYRAYIHTSASSQTGNKTGSVQTTYIANLFDGSLTIVSITFTYADKKTGTTLVTESVVSSGTFDPSDFSTTVITAEGSF
jgi:hypothetical protein